MTLDDRGIRMTQIPLVSVSATAPLTTVQDLPRAEGSGYMVAVE